MADKFLHIVAFDIVYPAYYGGAIDVYYRIKALHQAGVHIILHCTYKGDLQRHPELESLCEKVYYYKRNMSFLKQFHRLPYAVLTRNNSDLLTNLAADSHPILFEGLVTCYYLNHPLLANRRKFFRECNVEHDYYRQLAHATKSLYRKIYYRFEARKLQRFEKILTHADVIFALSHDDEKHFISSFRNQKVVYVPCFHPNNAISAVEGTGNYILYHGNLSVAENDNAARYICLHVVPLLGNMKVIIAGHNPSQELADLVAKYPDVQLVANPSDEEMCRLVRNAHIHLLITHQPTGMKLKLLNVLYQGRHVVVNSNMVAGTELGQLCHVADTPQRLAELCLNLMSKPFNANTISEREKILNRYFSNESLCSAITEQILNY